MIKQKKPIPYMRQRFGDPIDQGAHTNQPTKEISNFLAKNNVFCILSLSLKKKTNSDLHLHPTLMIINEGFESRTENNQYLIPDDNMETPPSKLPIPVN
jgi:patatin-like phospholipase/acyl hydrolase